MKRSKQILGLTLVLFLNQVVFATKTKKKETENKPVISFTENKGQVHDQNNKLRPDVLFGGHAKGMDFHLRNDGISYQVSRTDSWKDSPFHNENGSEGFTQIPDRRTIYRLDISWVNINNKTIVSTENPLEGYANYYLDVCPQGIQNVKSYEGVWYKNIYNKINLHYYQKSGNLKYDYIIMPGGNYKDIKLEIKGAQSISIQEDGSLILKTPLCDILEGAPIVYQNNCQLKAKWILKNNILSFDIENYNPSEQLIIDPVTRLWGTYYGDSPADYGRSCTTDISNNVYLAGYTGSGSGTIIATAGSHQTNLGGPPNDAFLAKFNTNGTRLWATYYGGNLDEWCYSVATDGLGNVYISGVTTSTNGGVISTAGSHQLTSGGSLDAFLVKFNSNGVRQWGTYYGGTGNEYGLCCNTDISGNIYLAGQTTSSGGTIIATTGAHQTTAGGINDAFLVKFNSSGVRQFGTYYGGNGTDIGTACKIDMFGNIFLAGYCTSGGGNIISTVGSHQNSSGGLTDAFIVKFDNTGVRQWGTYYGGAGNEYSGAIGIDNGGNVYLSGSSASGSAIATIGSHQPTFGGMSDAFLVKFDNLGVRQWGTYYGGSGNEFGTACVTNSSGETYFSGETTINTGTVIATAGSHQLTLGGGIDAFAVRFNSNGIREWGTYYGGTGDDKGYGCCIDANGNVYIAGITNTSTGTIIATVGSHQAVNGGTDDAFLIKFKNCEVLSPTAAVANPVCFGANINLTAGITGTAAPTYSWVGPNSFTSAIQNPSISNAGNLNIGTYTLTVNNNGCIETTTMSITSVNNNPTVTVVSNMSLICTGQSATLSANGAINYTYTPGGVGSSISISPTITTTYSVTGSNASGCTHMATVTQSVNACLNIFEKDLTGAHTIGKVYPNPGSGLFTVDFSIKNNSSKKIEILNILGQIIYSVNTENNKIEFDITHLSNGCYFIRLTNDNITNTIKVLKE
ncbi:MAG: SBBP repeat-containing protein [Bacteroidia bacterium]|nr:SBBP repeat-containing protein [Bacteroidia bacterium]